MAVDLAFRSVGPAEGLWRTWGFRLSALAFIAICTKSGAMVMHGLVGMVIILAAAVPASLLEGSSPTVGRCLRRGIALNRPLVLLVLWYIAGVVGKMYFSSAHDTSWRLITDSIMFLAALMFAFAYLQDGRTARMFQITYTVLMGAQFLVTAGVIVSSGVVVRQMVAGGLWSFGDQAMFATQALLMPLLLWRASVERGWLRILLFASCATIIYGLLICEFATPPGLLLVGVPTVAVLGLFYLWREKFVQRLLILWLLVGVGALAVVALSEHPRLQVTSSRIKQAWNDPQSGGYDNKKQADEGSRWMLAEISFASFTDSPLFGKGKGCISTSPFIGGHSSFFDLLGFYGLLGGGGAFIGMLLLMVRRAYVRMRRIGDWETVCAMSSLGMLIIVGIVDPYWQGMEPIMVLLFGRLFRIEGERA